MLRVREFVRILTGVLDKAGMIEKEKYLPLFGIDHRNEPLLIAGPCSAESEGQLMETARRLVNLGITVFRAGVWKPRTMPGSFEGRGEVALDWLGRVKKDTGMATVTEVATAQHLRKALDSGVDGVWIGARTSANPFAVQEIADALAEFPVDTLEALTVLIKNPVNPDLELWIGAIERVRRSGIRRIGAIHRGFSAYGARIYRNEPRWAIPIELRRRMPGLPVICDPSHIAGNRELVPTLAQQALDMGFDGLIIESHCNPDDALSDAAQQVLPSVLGNILNSLVKPEGSASSDSLDALRGEIDRIDDELLDLLARRMEVAREIGLFKKRNKLPVVQPSRYNDLMDRCVSLADRLKISPEFVRTVLAAIHEESVRQQL